MLVAQISLTLSRHFSLSFIASGRSSGLHPVSSHSCWMYVRAGRPAFARPCVGVHRSTSLMSSSLLLQQCPACLVRLTWIVFVIGGRWPYSWCLVGCCRQDLFKIARSILVQLPSSFFSSCFVSPCSASIYQYQCDRCLEETAFHFTQETTNTFLTPWLGDLTNSIVFTENFLTHWMIVEPRNKEKI